MMNDFLEQEIIGIGEHIAPPSVRVLTTSDGRKHLVYRGPRAIISYFIHLPQARVFDGGRTLCLPVTRETVMCLEVMGRLEEADDSYIAVVRELLQPSAEALTYYPAPVPNAPPPRPHQLAAFGWALDGIFGGRKGFVNACTLGCVAGETILNINRSGAGREYSIRDVYRRFHGCAPQGDRRKNQKWKRSIQTFARSLCDGEFRQHRVVDVLSQGVMPVVKLLLKSGKSIRLTGDHPVARPDGSWTRVDELRPGDEVLVNGTALCKKCGSSDRVSSSRNSKHPGYCFLCITRFLRGGQRTPSTLFEPDIQCIACGSAKDVLRTSYLKNKGYCRSCALRRAVDARRASGWKSPSGPQHPNWKGGRYRDNDGYILIKMPEHPRAQSSGYVYEHIVILEQKLDISITKDKHVHHKNENKADNRPENLELLDPSEHLVAHSGHRRLNGGRSGKGGEVIFIPKVDVVVSIVSDGETDVYDLVMEAPHHNFVANGIVVHNSGKTKMAIDLMRHFVQTRALVIGQKITLEQWQEQLALYWPEAESYILHQQGSLENRKAYLADIRRCESVPPYRIILVNWETVAALEKDLKKFGKFDLIVADESSRLLSRTTAMARAAKALAWRHAWYTIAMTGTPIRKSVEDLCALGQFVDSSVFGSRIAEFRQQYCDELWTSNHPLSVPKPERVAELVTKFYSFGYRVSRAAVDMPEPERRVVHLKPSQEQVEQLERIDRGETCEASNVLARIIRQQQVTAGFAMAPHDAPAATWDGEHEQILRPRPLHNPKLDWIMDYLEEAWDTEDGKFLIWTRFIPEIDLLHQRLVDRWGSNAVARLDGSTPDARRQEIRRAVNDRLNPLRVLACNLQTGAMGLDLPGIDIMVYHSSTFDYVNRVQSEGRGTRLGRTKPCQIIDLVLTGTIDEHIADVLAQKQSVHDLLVGQGFRQFREGS